MGRANTLLPAGRLGYAAAPGDTDKMGLSDRDYMKRRPEDDAQRASSPDAKVEAYLSGFLNRHPRFFLIAGAALAVLIVLAILIARLADKSP